MPKVPCSPRRQTFGALRLGRQAISVTLIAAVLFFSGCFEFRTPSSVADEARAQFADLRQCLGPFPGSVGEEVAGDRGTVAVTHLYATYVLSVPEASMTVAGRADSWWRDRCGVRPWDSPTSQKCRRSASHQGGLMALAVTLVTDQPASIGQCAEEGDRINLEATVPLPPEFLD